MAKISFDPTEPVIVLNVTIEGLKGKKKISAAVDTGATFTIIPWGVADVLGYEPYYHRERTGVITASGIEYAPVITLKSLMCLGMRVEKLKAIVHDLPAASYVDGLLGLNFLRNFKICLDFKDGIFSIE
jgi:clan AA aspartic protease (TIGR02281 family)